MADVAAARVPRHSTQPTEIVANSPTLIRAGDVNNDGQRDLITVNSTTGTLAARPGEPGPDGSIAPLPGARPAAVRGADAGAGLPTPVAVIRTAATPPTCPGDTNGDDLINGADLSVLLGQFGQSVPPYSGADVNGDGLVNGADLSVLLGRFGSGC